MQLDPRSPFEPPEVGTPVLDHEFDIDAIREETQKLVDPFEWDKVEDVTELPFVSAHLKGLADLFAERNAVYKDNFRMVGKLLEAMFPSGIMLLTEEHYNKFHLFMLAIVKLSRYVINYDEGHKDSLDDMIVYLSMVAALDKEREELEKAQGH